MWDLVFIKFCRDIKIAKVKYNEKDICTSEALNLSCYFSCIESEIQKNISENSNDYIYYFRGEPRDFGDTALRPSVYRKSQNNDPNQLENEHLLFREIMRFNYLDFVNDLTAFDNLSRMQHYTLPTRMLDFTEDPLSALWFAISESEKEHKKKKNAKRIKILLEKKVLYIWLK